MKRIGLLFVFIALVLTSCNKEVVDYKAAMEGVWVCQNVDNKYVQTDKLIVLDFKPDGSVVYYRGVNVNKSHSTFAATSLKYVIEDQCVTIFGVANADTIMMKLDILFISDGKFTAERTEYQEGMLKSTTVSKMLFNKVNQVDKHDVVLKGEWEGYRHRPVSGYDSVASIKMKFEADRNFSFSKRLDGNWVTCNGNYWLFGDVVAVNYATEVSGYYDCWRLTSVGEEQVVIERFNSQSDSAAVLNIDKYKLTRIGECCGL